MTTAAYHHGNLRSALLEQAEVALREVGVEGLSLRQVARDLGVSHGAPARHFRDKQALLDALALTGFESLNEQLATAAASTGTFRDRFDATARAYVDFAMQHSELLNVMYTTKHGEEASEQLREIGSAGMTTAMELIAEAQLSGQIRSGEPGVLAVVMQAQVHGVAVLASGGLLNGLDLETVLAATLDLLWRALALEHSVGSSDRD